MDGIVNDDSEKLEVLSGHVPIYRGMQDKFVALLLDAVHTLHVGCVLGKLSWVE